MKLEVELGTASPIVVGADLTMESVGGASPIAQTRLPKM